MGIIIVDGKAALRYKGPISGFVEILNVFEAMPNKGGSVKIDTVPMPDKVAIDTVPLPERVAFEIYLLGIPLSEFAETITKLEMAYEKLKDRMPPPPVPWAEWTITTQLVEEKSGN